MTFDFSGRPRPLRPDRVDPAPGGGGDPIIPLGSRGRRPWWLIPGAVVAVIVVLGFLVLSTAGFWANILWFDSLGYRGVLFTRYEARGLAFLVGLLIAAAFLAANILVAARIEGGLPSEIAGVAVSRRMERWVLFGGIAVLAFFFATAAGSQWDLFLRF